MTLHVRPPLPTAEFEKTVEGAHFSAPENLYRNYIKRLLDVTLVVLASPLILAVVLVFATLIATDGKNPFFRQKRLGHGGRAFGMWKLRSMVHDADKHLEAYLDANPAARSEWERNQKLRHDPRITPIGRLIRKTSLDELPQLWNVLRGHMSLVGPRPMMLDQQSLYPGKAYYVLRPGVTGFWQISVRNESSFAERAKFDTAYLHRMSFKTDFAVLLRTVKVVISGTGC